MKKTILALLLLSSFNVFSQTAGDYYKRAVAKYRSGDYAGAAVEYTRALEIKENSAVLHNNRGVCYYRIQKYNEALTDYDRAIELDDKMADAHYNKGNTLRDLLRNEQALIAYDKAIALRTNDKKYFQNRGILRSELGDDMGAIELDPTYYKALINRGICNVQLDESSEAKKDFNLAIQLSPRDGEGYYYRGLATINDMNLIKEEFKHKRNLALIQENMFALKEACSDFEKAKSFEYSRSYDALIEYCKDRNL